MSNRTSTTYRTRLIVDVAKAEAVQAVFVGSTASRLAIQLVTDVAQGKGNQIHLEAGLKDDRFEVPLIKPLREFVAKEVLFYNRTQNVTYRESVDFATKQPVKASLGRLSEAFINSLQRDFPATVYTLFKISSKVVPSQTSDDKCELCGVSRRCIPSERELIHELIHGVSVGERRCAIG